MTVTEQVLKARRKAITVEAHEWRELVADAQVYGLTPGAFLLLVWRNWRSKRETLALIPELPVDPYRREKVA